ncbi:MAG: lipopolysaccharide biosynthesis protein, partial [Bacteroidota bacterium]
MGIAVLRILSVAILARLLNPEDFGLVQGATIVTSFLEVFSMLGVAPALVQFKKLTKDHISTAFTFSIAFGCLLSLLLWFSADYIESFFQFDNLSEVLKTLVLIFPINSISVVSQNLLYRKLDYQKIAKADIFGFTGYAVTGVILALLGWEYWALVFGHYASSIIKSILLFIFQPHSIRPSIHHSAFFELFHFGSGITLSSFFNYIAMKGDYLIIGRFLGASALGIYGRSYNLMASSVSLFGSVLDKVLFAAMARKQDDTEKLEIAFKRSVSIVGFTVLPVSTFTILIAPEIIMSFLGTEWEEAIIPFQVLASTMVFRIGYKMNGALARAKGLVFKLAGRQAFYAAAILVGTLVGQRYGLVGASIGVALAFLAHYCYMTKLSLRILPDLTWFSIFKLYQPALIISFFTTTLSFLLVKGLRGFALPE